MYIYIHTYIHTYIHVYIYIYTHTPYAYIDLSMFPAMQNTPCRRYGRLAYVYACLCVQLVLCYTTRLIVLYMYMYN